MSFDDIQVGVRVQADTEELKQAIRDFKDGKIAIDDLVGSTKQLKAGIVDQRRAYSTLRQAQRLQNFQLIESMRVVRSASSLFFQLNQVLQTNLLTNIEQNQVTVAQREAFRDLIGETDELVRALDILGPANANVERGFDNLIQKADSLNSEQLERLITQLERVRNDGNLSGEQLQFLNAQLAILRDLLKETTDEEEKQGFEDLLDFFVRIGATAGPLAIFVLKLQETYGVLTKLLPFIARNKGPIGLLATLLFGSAVPGIIPTAGDKTFPELSKEPSGGSNIGNLGDFLERVGPPGTTVNVKVDNIQLNDPAQLFTWAQRIADEIEFRKGQSRR